MILVDFNPGNGILEAKYIGDVTLKDVVDYIRATKENEAYPRVLKILSDGTKANMKILPTELSVIVDENNKSLEKYDLIIDAIVLSSPKETALSFLYQELAKNKKYSFQVFSTIDAALKWLDSF